MQKTGILLINLGTPESPTPAGVRHYLAEFLSDRRVINLPRLIWLPILHGLVLPLRAKRVAGLYQSIWQPGGSPLRVLSQSLADKLQVQCGENVLVKLAMCYGRPSIAAQLDSLKQCEKIIILPLYPQYSSTTTAAVFDQVSKALKTWALLPQFEFIPHYYNHPQYVSSVAHSIQQYWQTHGKAEKLLFSFHGLPQRNIDQGDPYQQQCIDSVKLITEQLNLNADEWLLTFQSRFGFAKWIGPATISTLVELAEAGIQEIDVVCPGFAIDCLETLEEIQHTNQEAFIKAGGKKLRYIPALNDTAEHVGLMQALLKFD